jgi:hypothetical protein
MRTCPVCGCEFYNGTDKYCSTACKEAVHFIQFRAVSKVNREVALGNLKKATEHVCVDCGKPAKQYEHRNYSKPLDVEPVCRGCNKRRGPALDIAFAISEYMGVQISELRHFLTKRNEKYEAWRSSRTAWPDFTQSFAGAVAELRATNQKKAA